MSPSNFECYRVSPVDRGTARARDESAGRASPVILDEVRPPREIWRRVTPRVPTERRKYPGSVLIIGLRFTDRPRPFALYRWPARCASPPLTFACQKSNLCPILCEFPSVDFLASKQTAAWRNHPGVPAEEITRIAGSRRFTAFRGTRGPYIRKIARPQSCEGLESSGRKKAVPGTEAQRRKDLRQFPG